ncbi:hypothetical protein B296_00054357 [Ensete ventricosum]|uniref:Aminotransferase class I/classII domain-containing protein n=1 Tax=Ensete ventricosum TaxID=4639 RepID=A0A426Y4E9_ENSVE|nr:hypothetical protein B296_00054357 [Ensete ventricosum]
MASLESTLEKLTHKNKQAEKIRRYIVVEAIYQKYRFRVILDESHSFGVLGNSGRGLAEYYGVPVLTRGAPATFGLLVWEKKQARAAMARGRPVGGDSVRATRGRERR